MKQKSITITKNAKRRLPNSLSSFFGVLFLAAIILPQFSRAQNREISAGFIFDRFKLTLENGWRTEAAGPFYYSQEVESNTLWAVPPLFSQERAPDVESEWDDFLYPLFTKIRHGNERRWQFFELLSTSSGMQPDETGVRQFTLFPIYFYQRAADSNLNYTAVVPFYGTIKNRLFRDELHFVMLPLYVESRKRDVVIDNYFWPFVDVRCGDGLTGWQFWPFVGREHKDVTTQTNGFGDVSLVPGHDHWFYLWPFYLKQNNGIGADNPEKIRASIPFFASERSPQRDSTSVLWPFFTSIDDRARKYHEWQGPWPFVIWARGEGKTTSRVWPLFSQSHNATLENDSYLWPIYTYSRAHADPLDRSRTRIAFYLYSQMVEKNTETGHEKIRVDSWPFFTWHRDFDGRQWLQILALVEAAVPDNRGIQNNWSPLWSLWRSEENPQTGASSQSVLWNLYRREVRPQEKSVACFFGLVQFQAGEHQRQLRLFYLPAIHLRSPASAPE
jgi:hypothetical protein